MTDKAILSKLDMTNAVKNNVQILWRSVEGENLHSREVCIDIQT